MLFRKAAHEKENCTKTKSSNREAEKGIEGLKEALNKINQIKPQDCRDHVIKNFSTQIMVDNYEKTYQEIINLKTNK